MVVCFLSMSTLSELIQKFRSVWPLLDERTRRIMAANEAVSLGFGGISVVHRACGLSRRAIAKGISEIQEGIVPSEGRIRCPGAGRKSITVSDPRLLEALEEMIDCQTRGDPQSPLRWICKSTRAIARQLGRKKKPGARHSCNFGGHKKERTHRQLQQCRSAMASGKTTQKSSRSRFPYSRSSTRLSLWHLRPQTQRRFCQCGNRP